MIAHINIGSNLGHRADMLARAVSMLDPRVGKVLAVSKPIETAPDGFDSENLFLNIGVNVETRLSPKEIVDCLKEIEMAIDPDGLHRDTAGNYCDRKIDLDLICLGSTICADPRATVPHPRMTGRKFVLIPLAELLPNWRHPQLRLTSSELLKRIIIQQQ